jgi:hypothetical protein
MLSYSHLPVIGPSDDDPHQQKLLAQIVAVCVRVIFVYHPGGMS